MERSVYLDKAIQRIKKDSAIEEIYKNILPTGETPILNNKISLVERIKELEVLVDQLATGLNKQQSEFVNLKTFIGFNE